ncbi:MULTISPECIES: hypothetical protein [unclassified Rhizobium]|uniref:hypothetical protein n=1 Tax=unclassified Rhizobium TaxID=2613769 RepID=UPI001C5A6576|nr:MULTISPECIES: hypothetical protein [unclassified Rhizobium]QXZ84569.1 hypothetical protein J5287_03220 [Rhizobium sp. K1/93]QXZ91291.1 hypothetical protein J5280_06780 [Rhizobium sp. K15/93]
MSKPVDNDNDAAAVPETAYQGWERAMSGRGKSLSFWGLAVAVVFVVGLAAFAMTREVSHTNPAPNGGAGTSGAVSQPAPAQSSQ